MAEYIKSNEFARIVIEFNYDLDSIHKYIMEHYDSYARKRDLKRRIMRMRQSGKLPLDSGNKVSVGEILKGTSTLYDDQNNVVLQWVKSDASKEAQLEAISSAITEMATLLLPAIETIKQDSNITNDDSLTVYISNDIHFGALMWAPESGTDWDLDIAVKTVTDAYDYLFETTPPSKSAIISDLGDLMEVDSFKNLTPQSGNPLAVDGRFPKILRAAYMSLVYAIDKALQKHEIVHFINIAGNHDMTVGHAIREIIRAVYRNNPRVVIDESPSAIKYFIYDEVLLQFAHGDGLKMKDAGEVMAADCEAIFSQTRFRYAHFGHNHKDSVIDGRLCRAESHRNLAPTNDWAAHKGYRRQLGTMKAITYHANKGEIGRNLFTIT